MRTLCMHTDTIFYVWECSWPFLPLKRTQYLSRKMNQLNKVNIVNMIFCFRYPSEHSIQHSRRFGILQSWLLWALLPEIFSASGGLSLIFLCDILKCKAQQRLAGKQQYRPWVLDDLWICELWNNNEVKNRGVGGGAAHGCTNDAQVTHAAAQSADRSWMFMVNGFLWNDVECHWLFNGCARKDRIPDVRHTVDRHIIYNHIISYICTFLYPVALERKGSRDGALWTNEHTDFLLQRFGSRPRLTFLTEVAHLGRSVFGLRRRQCNIQLHKLFLQDMFKRDEPPLEGWFQSVWEQVLHYIITIVKTYRKGLPELVAILVIWVANVSPGWLCVLAFLTSPEGPSRWTVG